MKVFKQAISYSVILFFSLMTHLFGLGMSPLMFKNVGECYKPGFEMYAPMFGSAALTSGFIENLRFYNVIAGPNHKDTGTRIYSADKAFKDDYVMEVLLLLFSSPAGQLTTEGNAKGSIGNHLTEEDVALLYNFVHEVRSALKTDERGIQWEDKGIPKKRGKKEGIKHTDLDSISKKFISLIESKYVSNIENRFQKKFKQDVSKLFKSIAKVLQQERKFYFSSEEFDGKKDKQAEWLNKPFYPPYIIEQILGAFFCHKFATQKSLRALLNALNSDIVDQSKIEYVNVLFEKVDIEEAFKHLVEDEKVSLSDIWLLLNRNIFSQIIPYTDNQTPISNGRTKKYDRTNDVLSDQIFADCVETTIRHLMNMIFFNQVTNTFDLGKLDSFMEGKDQKYIKNLKDFYAEQSPNLANAGGEGLRSLWNKVVADLPGVTYVQGTNEVETGMLNMIRVFSTIFQLDLGPEPQWKEGEDGEFIDAVKNRFIACFNKVFEPLNPQDLFIAINIIDEYMFRVNSEELYDVAGRIVIAVEDKNRGMLYEFPVKMSPGHLEIGKIGIRKEDFSTINNEHFQIMREEIKRISFFAEATSLSLLDEGLVGEYVYAYAIFSKSLYDTFGQLQGLDQLSAAFGSCSEELILGITKNIMDTYLWSDENSRKMIYEKIFSLNNESFQKYMKSSLPILDLSWNMPSLVNNLKTIDLSEFPRLKKIIVKSNSTLEEIGGEATVLEEIFLQDISLPRMNIASFPTLKGLSIDSCKNLESLKLASGSVEKFFLKKVFLSEIDLSLFTNLQSLELVEFKLNILNLKIDQKIMFTDIVRLPFSISEILIKDFNAFNQNIIFDFSSLIQLKKVALINQLKKLSIDLVPEFFPQSIEQISLQNFSSNNFELKSLPQLQSLHLSHFSTLKTIGIQNLPKLKHINFDFLITLKDITLKNLACEKIDLSKITGVKKVHVQGWKELSELIGNNIVSTLELTGGSSLTQLDLAGFPVLENLTIIANKALSILRGSSDRLKEIRLINTVIEELDVTNLKALESLSISSVFKTKNGIKKIYGLSDTLTTVVIKKAAVETIDLSQCKNISSLSVENCPDLKELTIPKELAQELKESLYGSFGNIVREV